MTVQEKLQKALEHFKSDLATLRTGKATAQLLDPVRVEAYGSMMRLVEVARVSVPDATLLVVTPYDSSLLSSIEKAIASAGLNLQPVVDKDLIRISVPPLTQERRKEMVTLVDRKTEETRVMVRNIRSDAKKDIENQKGSDGVSEDDIKSEIAELESTIQKHLDQLEVMAQEKQQELMTI